ncbi:MAG: amino acid ABC transporter substrate-binding protein [Deltaproteobacteria bacterium]|nr:amino acid ABC transporter substrate-binding protein [Deltaproteobacteria bacterium]
MRAFLIFLFVLAIIPADLKSETKTKEIIFAGAESGKPLCWIENGVVKGYQIDLARELFQKRLGLKLVTKAFPWKRAQHMVKIGDADFLITANLPFRQKYSVANQQQIMNYNMSLYTYKKHPKLNQIKRIKTLEGLRPFRIGAYLGSGWANIYLKDKGYNVEWVPGANLNIKKLAHGRVDICVESPLMIYSIAQQLGVWDKIQPLNVSVYDLHFYILISKKSKYLSLLPLIDEVIKDMKRDGTWKKIDEKYRKKVH